MRPEWTSDLTLDDLPDEWRGLADVIGLDHALETIAYFGGSEPYCPQFEGKKLASARNRIMKERWHKYKSQGIPGAANKLAREFGVQRRTVLNIVGDCEEQSEIPFE